MYRGLDWPQRPVLLRIYACPQVVLSKALRYFHVVIITMQLCVSVQPIFESSMLARLSNE